MFESAITGKENASKDWNCIILMFLSFNIYVVFGYVCFMWICLKIAICFFLAFLVITDWQPWSTLVSSSMVRWPRSSHHSCSWAFKAVEQHSCRCWSESFTAVKLLFCISL